MKRNWIPYTGTATLRKWVAAFCDNLGIKYKDLGGQLELLINEAELDAINDFILEV